MDQKLTRKAALAANWTAVRQELDDAARAAGRDPATVRLVAVSKFHPAEDIRTLAELGQQDFGESYAQEAQAKAEALWDVDIRWHFIGRLQANKAKFVAGAFHLVHSVDSPKLARSLQSRLRGQARQEVLLQVNLAGEAQKGGAQPDEVRALAEGVLQMDGLGLRGLMVMPPFSDDAEASRPVFSALREMRDRLERQLGAALPELSMGMTHDFRQAVAEGATLEQAMEVMTPFSHTFRYESAEPENLLPSMDEIKP